MAGIDINRTTTGVELPEAVSSEIWAATIEQSAIMQAARQVSLPGSGITIPLVTAEATAEWVAETDEKPVSRPTVSNKSMTPYMLAVIVPFSNQFRRDLPGLYNELVRRLPFSLGRKFDATASGADAAPGSGFDTLASAPLATVDGTNTFTDVAGVLNTVAAADAELSHWIAKPALHALLLTTTDALGRQMFISSATPGRTVGSMFGAPVIRTNADLDDGITGLAGDFAGSAVWGSVEGIQVSISDQATLTDGEATINLWQRNMFAVRAEIEVGFVVRDVNHFVRITDGTATS